MPSRVKLVDFAKKEKIDGVDWIVFQFAPIHMVEVGIYTIYLTLIKSSSRVSPTPIKVRFYDNVSQEDLSFISLINDIRKRIDEVQLKLAQGININEINSSNGIASLDNNKKIIESQIPDFIKNHITSYVRSEEGVHDIKITPQGIAMVKDKNGVWNNIIFSNKSLVEDILLPHTPPHITIQDSIVTITYPDNDIPTIQKWDDGERQIPWFKENGFILSQTFEVQDVGNYTLYYKLQDGREYVVVFEVKIEDLKAPNIIISVSDGEVTVESDATISISKYAKDRRDMAYFQNNGTVFTDKFTVTEVGTYTVYYKLQDGREYVVVFSVVDSQLPIPKPKKPIKDLEQGTIVNISGDDWEVLEPSTGMLWYADEVKTWSGYTYWGYDVDLPRQNRTRNFAIDKTTHVAYFLNVEFYNGLETSFKNALRSIPWKNGTEIAEDEYTVDAKVGLLTLSEWLKYKSILRYTKPGTVIYSYTMTKDSSNPLYIFAYPNNNEDPLSPHDIFQYGQPDGNESMSVTRPVVYADPNFEV